MLKELIKDKFISHLIIYVDLCSSVDKYKINLSDYLLNNSPHAEMLFRFVANGDEHYSRRESTGQSPPGCSLAEGGQQQTRLIVRRRPRRNVYYALNPAILAGL